MPRSVSNPMPPDVLKTYQQAQPSPEARRGVAEFPRQIRDARSMLERLANEAPRALGNKPMELVWAMKDPAFGSQAVIARWQRDFPSANLTRVPQANHYIQEDAPEAIATAVDRVEARLLKRER
jgi:haloalkane dehalogenase